MSTHNQCFRAKIRRKCIPCTPQFHYTKVGCKGVYITRTCYHDALNGYEMRDETSTGLVERLYILTCNYK